VNEEGDEVESLPSTLGVEMTIEEVAPERLLDHVTPVVYQLDPAELDDALRAALADRTIFETRFNYRTSYAGQACFLVANDAGFFALVGQPAGFAFLEPDEAPAAADAGDDDPFADDFDFGML